jgi:predicted O-linked N-acetylglucosamine transferase (SPINDLY family)
MGPGIGRLWARLLDRVPGSRLLLKSINLGPGSTRRLMLERLASWGIDPSRVDLRAGNALRRDHLGEYAPMDVALDTYPYHGTTTTCEALWMGVPVVTLAGRVHASRVGVSLLTAAGLPELIAPDENAYLRIAAELAADRGRLASMRGGLRDRLRASTLCDAPAYTRRVEGALREMWRAWCARP